MLSVDSEVNRIIAKAAAVMARLNHRVWKNPSLIVKTKARVYQAYVISTLLYDSEALYPTYANQERKLNSFHLRCLRRIVHVQRHDNIPTTEVLERANMTGMFAILSARRVRWLGHVRRKEPGRTPNVLPYGELATGLRPPGRPSPRCKHICKPDLKRCSITSDTWER